MLGWSISLFRVFGIQLSVHVSFLLFLGYFGYEGWNEAGGLGAAWNLVLVILFFACVVMHELGHSLTARRYGVQVPRILLMPIGGMAEMDRIPRRPSAELLITIAGPAVNVVIVVLLLPLIWTDLWSTEAVPAHSLAELLINLAAANAVMAVFNLLPVFPMDGGRILRALLALRFPYLRATYWAALLGKVLAVIFAGGAVYFFSNYLMAALFLFIFFVGEAEYRHLLRREREEAYWAEWYRRAAAREVSPGSSREQAAEPPVIPRGPN